MNFRLHISCFLLILNVSTALAHELAVTFDDLPNQQDESAQTQYTINETILQALDEFNAPAHGFVNEGRIYASEQIEEKKAILSLWIKHRQPLANHTYSHFSMHDIPLADFKQDVLKGSLISKQLMSEAGLEYNYFRHPFLHTGLSAEQRSEFESFLKRNGYLIAPVTIDTNDWEFNAKIVQHPEQKDAIIQAYLNHTRKKFAFYQYATEKIFNRNIKHIWLLHVNILNSYTIRELLKIAQEFDYTFINLNEALKDPAYLEPDHFYENNGVTYLYRWDYTRGEVVDWSLDPQPETIREIMLGMDS